MFFDRNDNDDYEQDFYDRFSNDPGDQAGSYGSRTSRPGNRQSMRFAATVLGIISIFSFMMIYISVPLGALAIILALLSRGSEKRLGKAKTAVSLGAAGILASCAITGFAFYRVTTDPVLRAQMQQMVNYYTGTYLGESASEAFPWLFEKESERENESEPVWSNDLLNDHDRLVDYFTKPHGDNGSDLSDQQENAAPPDPDISTRSDGTPIGGNYT